MSKSSKQVRIHLNNVGKFFKVPHEDHSDTASLLSKLGRKTYTKLQVLKNIDFDIKDGEFIGIVGRNGSGKSTLLKILAGIYFPNSGSVDINGHVVPFLELGVGFNPELSARDNVYLNASILGLTKKQTDEVFDDIIEFAELEDFVDQKLKNYSSGMQVRLAFSVAIRAQSDILLLDEVLAVGDARFQVKSYDVFRKYKREGRTVVFVSHDMDKVQEYCSRAIYLRDGEVVLDGKPADVAAQYTLDMSANPRANSPSRRGDENINIKSAVFSNGQNKSVFNHKDDIELKISFEAKKKSPVIVGIGISKDDHYIGGFNSRLDIDNYTAKKGLNEIVCKVDGNQLGIGAFAIDVLISERAESSRKLLDRVNNIATLHITDRVVNRDGIINLRGSWAKKK